MAQSIFDVDHIIDKISTLEVQEIDRSLGFQKNISSCFPSVVQQYVLKYVDLTDLMTAVSRKLRIKPNSFVDYKCNQLRHTIPIYNRKSILSILNIALVSKSWYYWIQRRINHILIKLESRWFQFPLFRRDIDCMNAAKPSVPSTVIDQIFDGWSLFQPKYITSLKLKFGNIYNTDARVLKYTKDQIFNIIISLPRLETLTITTPINETVISILTEINNLLEENGSKLKIHLIINLPSSYSAVHCQMLASLPSVVVNVLNVEFKSLNEVTQLINIIRLLSPMALFINNQPTNYQYHENWGEIFRLPSLRYLYIDKPVNANLITKTEGLWQLGINFHPTAGLQDNFIKSLYTNKSINTLKLIGCRSPHLAELLKNNRSITSLIVRDYVCTGSDQLVVNDVLESLTIGHKELSDTLWKSLGSAKSLHTLCIKVDALPFGEPYPLSVESLTNLLKTNRNIQTLQIGVPNCKFVIDFLVSFIEVLKHVETDHSSTGGIGPATIINNNKSTYFNFSLTTIEFEVTSEKMKVVYDNLRKWFKEFENDSLYLLNNWILNNKLNFIL